MHHHGVDIRGTVPHVVDQVTDIGVFDYWPVGRVLMQGIVTARQLGISGQGFRWQIPEKRRELTATCTLDRLYGTSIMLRKSQGHTVLSLESGVKISEQLRGKDAKNIPSSGP